mmetsp:Transcript_3951/g.6525  ORF Transcript_3951/g.6525 Transcript_3951/m.6525 type:complete len:343 (+) Transcript_3951:31-1059(+)
MLVAIKIKDLDTEQPCRLQSPGQTNLLSESIPSNSMVLLKKKVQKSLWFYRLPKSTGITSGLLLLCGGGAITNFTLMKSSATNNKLRHNHDEDDDTSPYLKGSNKNKFDCPLDGSFDPPGSEIIIDYDKIRTMDKSPLEKVQNFTTDAYVKFMLEDAGTEHYAFLNYLSNTYGDCRHFTDIGTRVVASSVAIGSNLKSPVWTFDIPTSKERYAAFRGDTEEQYQAKAKSIGLDIKFHNLDLLKVSDEELKEYVGTWFVMLDTFHEPDTSPFEREFFQRLLDIKFKGILGLDDIYLNAEMKQWWKEVQDGALDGGYATYDISEVGHYSGTGLVDFSGKVVIKK